MKRTLHWYFTLGTMNRDARYYLDQSISVLLKAAGIFPELEKDELHTRTALAKSTTAGLLKLLGKPQESWSIRLRCIETSELRKSSELNSAPLELLRQDLPEWVNANTLEQPVSIIEEIDPNTIQKIIQRLLDDERQQFQEGDAVFFESTQGLRPIQMAMTLSAELLQTLRPDVTALGTVYAEFGIKDPSALNPPPKPLIHEQVPKLTPIYNMSPLLSLPRWASSVRAFQERLDTSWLADMLSRVQLDQGDDKVREQLVEALSNLSSALDLGLADRMIQPLHKIQETLAELDIPGVWQVVEPLLRNQVDHLLSEDVVEGELSLASLNFQLKVVHALVESNRYGDAIRVLRELMVSRMVLSQQSTFNKVNDDKKTRSRAEQALHFSTGELAKLWDEVTTLRNGAAHVEAGRSVEEESNLIRDLSQTFAPEDNRVNLLAKVETLWNRDDLWVMGIQVNPLIVWLTTNSDRRSNIKVQKYWSSIVNAWSPTEDIMKVSTSNNSESQLQTVLAMLPEHQMTSAVAGKNWAQKQWEKLKILDKDESNTQLESQLRSSMNLARHVVFYDDLPFKTSVLLLKYAQRQGVFCWRWEEGHGQGSRGLLIPLFNQEEADRVFV